MPRTPLARLAQRFYRQAGLAMRLNVPLNALDDPRVRSRTNGHSSSRRKFIVNLAGAAAGVALSATALAHPIARTMQPRIAIVGVGIAGLNAALTLADRGFSPAVYEAAPRVGGRMFSNNAGYWADNQVSEWCGELIDTEHSTIRALAARFNLALDNVHAAEPAGSTDTFYFNGAYYKAAEMVQDFSAIYTLVKDEAAGAGLPNGELSESGFAIDHTSLWRWIETRVPGGHGSAMGRLLDAAYATEYGADTHDQSALNLVYQLSGSDQNFQIYGTSDESFRIRGGNELLPGAMAEFLQSKGTRISRGMSMRALRMLADGTYRLTFDTGSGTQQADADLVVLTLPFAVLRSLECHRAGFDALKRVAIRDLGRGRTRKLQLQYTRRLWNESGPWGVSTGSSFSDAGYQNTWEPSRAQAGTSGIVNNFTAGGEANHSAVKRPFAVAGSREFARDVARFHGQIEPVFPGLSGLWNGKGTHSLPHLSPFFKCTYAYYRVGQVDRFSGYEGVRQGNVFFAGEHTSDAFQGYMEGAAQEGARAAGEILMQLGVMAR